MDARDHALAHGHAPPRLRRLAPADAPALAPFATAQFRATYGRFYARDTIDGYVCDAFAPARLATELADPATTILLAEAEDGTPVAWVHVRLRPVPDGDGSAGSLEIARLYVDAAWHGRGIAPRLMDAVRAEASVRGAARTWLQVWPRNARAIAFYQRQGFVRAGTVPFDFGGVVEEDWIMVRDDERDGMRKVTLTDAFASVTEHWKPRLAAELNGQHVKLSKFQGAFIWHHHEHEDELFLVHRGSFRMELRDRTIELSAGDFLVVPRGVEHRPVADEEVEVLLFEPAGTLNTGNVRDARTRDTIERL